VLGLGRRGMPQTHAPQQLLARDTGSQLGISTCLS
jgi:hypothetical protein